MAGNEKTSQLLPLFAGSIKYPEEYSKIQVNCITEMGGGDPASTTGLESVDLEVLFPVVKDLKDHIPLNGGAIVKLVLSGDTETGSDPEKALRTGYAEAVAKLAEYVKGNIPHVSSDAPEDPDGALPFVSVSNLVKIRVAVNKALEDMPALTKEWHQHGVPTLALSKTRTKRYSSKDSLQAALDKDKKVRLKELGRPVGYFKYIPPQILSNIFDALMNKPGDEAEDPEYGLWNSAYKGISGDSFSMMAGVLSQLAADKDYALKDPEVVKILLDLFPIVRVRSRAITAGVDSLPVIGYYTAHKKSLYIKMPDLSGRDSNGDSQNIYGLGDEEKGDIRFCFELVKDVYKYAGKAFDFVPPPALEVKDGEVEYPDLSESIRQAEISILKSGIDEGKLSEHRFFLSPILPAGSGTSSRGLKTTDRAVEMFTAPVLTKPFFKGEAVVTYPPKVKSRLIYELSKKLKGAGAYRSVFNDTSAVGHKETDASSEAGELTHLEFDDHIRETPSTKHRYEFTELGVPMSESLTSLGVDSIPDLLGEANRPEVLMGFRDGKGPERTNEAKYYDVKGYGAQALLASNRPNIITDLYNLSQLPAMWIPLFLVLGPTEDDFYKLKVPYALPPDFPGPRSSLEIYNNMGLLKFALYVVDHMGQISRAPGKNIQITPNSPKLTYADPHGFSGEYGEIVLHSGVKLKPSFDALGAPALSSGLRFTGEGFVGQRDSLSVNIYADKDGQILLKSLRHGMDLGSGNTLEIKDVDEFTIALESKSSIGALFPELIGTFYVGIQLLTGVTSDLTPLHISAAGTSKGDLPTKGVHKTTFKDSFGLEIIGFDEAVHSVPIIQDSANHASLTIKAPKKTFSKKEAKTELYAYIAVLDTSENKDILASDIGWEKDDGHKKKAILKVPIKTGISDKGDQAFYIPTALEWKFGESDFKRDSGRKATLKFPGSNHTTINMSRFTELSAKGKKEYPAYILLVNSKLSEGGDIPSLIGGGRDGTYDYAVIPIGSPGHAGGLMGDKSGEEPAFVTVPEILGIIAELPSSGGESRIISNIPKAVLVANEGLREAIDGMNPEAINDAGGQSIISADALTRLSVIFRGNKIPQMEKMHKASIGSQKLDEECTSVEYAGKGMVVANYKNISGIKSEGWTDILLKKTDKRFKCSYDSTLYSRVTINVFPDGLYPPLPFLNEDGKLASGENLLISSFGDPDAIDTFHNFVGTIGLATDEKPRANLSTVIFPGGNGDFTPLPLLKGKSYALPAIATDSAAYYRFSNPIKIKPSLDIILGAMIKGNIIGCGLTDAKVDDSGNPIDEIISINTSGATSATMSLIDMAAAVKQAKIEAESVFANIKKSVAKMKDETDKQKADKAQAQKDLEKTRLNYEEKSGNAEAAIEDAQTSLSKEAADQAAMDAAMARQQADGGEGSAGGVIEGLEAGMDAAAGAAAAAAKAAEDALGAINDALGMIKTISDALSSIADIANQIADGVEGAISARTRPDDFVKANLKYIYVDKDNVINSSQFMERDDKASVKLVTEYKFSQTSAIKFNTPEIVSIKKSKDSSVVYLPFGDNPFSKMRIKTGDEIFLQVIGANEDTKIEIAGKRVKAERDTPFSVGIFQNFKLKIEDMSSFSIFGTSDCISIAATNSNEDRMRLGRQMGNDLTLNLEDTWNDRIFTDRNKEGPGGDLAKHLEENASLKFLMVKLGKVAGGAKESLQSFCDFSFHLTAELSLQLRNFQVLLIPIKVIFCIIDVICALLNPWRLAFAIIRLFLCLYDLILLLPQLAVPAMFLALLLHLLNLLLCVIMKILSWVNAINEIITATVKAVEHRNYPAIAALEETLNEHLFSLETDLSVLEPIITILNLFLQLLQLGFAFPCRIGADDDAEACIDPSQLAGIILGKVAPTGAIAPNVLLPLAQAYTRLPPADSGYYGNSPPGGRDNKSNVGASGDFRDDITGKGNQPKFDIVVRPQDEVNSIIANKTLDVGEPIPNMINMATGEANVIQEGGYFKADSEGNGRMDNIEYSKLRTNYVDGTVDTADDFYNRVTGAPRYYGANAGYFDATFSLSYTKGTKDWGFFTGPDPRIVRFNFDSGGVTSDIAWWTWWLIFPIFFSKKRVSSNQTIDSKPMFLGKNNNQALVVGGRNFISPIDGFDNFVKPVGAGYQPRPLTVTFELNEPGINMETFDAEFTPTTVTKTFGNIPMIAIVDDEFNVYFVEEDGTDGGIEMSGKSISSINLKMLNKPSAPKHKTSRQKEMAFSDEDWYDFRSFKAETVAWLAEESPEPGLQGFGPYDWNNNRSSKHKVSSWPEHNHLENNPVSGTRYTEDNYYTSNGPNVDANGLSDEDGDPDWREGENKYGVTRSGEAIMQATANAMWLKGETVDNDEMRFNGSPVSDMLGNGVTSPEGATTIDYILHTASAYRYNKALHCVWGHEEYNDDSPPTPTTEYVAEVPFEAAVPATAFTPAIPEVPFEAEIPNSAGTPAGGDIDPPAGAPDYTDFPEKRIQTLKNKTLTFFLSTENGDPSPYNDLSDPSDGDGNPYWPVDHEAGDYGGRKGMVVIHILAEEDMYDPDAGTGTPDRLEVKWTADMDKAIPYPEIGMAYDFGGGSTWEQGDIGNSITAVKVYDFPQFYIVDMRQLADDIASACGASGPAELLLDLPGFEEPFEDHVQDMLNCLEKFLEHFNSEDEDENGEKIGLIAKIRDSLAKGEIPARADIGLTLEKYYELVECVGEQIDNSCRFVVNPLNTSFKLLGDEDETPLPGYIDPEQADPGALGNAGIIDELEFDEELAGFPSITGAMEYASGIGDTLIVEVGSKALVELLPRDCYDDLLPKALDLTDKIEIEFVSDETGNAELVTPYDDSEGLTIKDEEKYTMAVIAHTPGKVVIKGSVCGVVIQAVTDKGIVSGLSSAGSATETESAESLEGCIEDAANSGLGSASDTEDDSFAPGSLMKVDRTLTLLYVPKGASGAGGGMGGPGGLYGDADRDASARSAKPGPQTSGTKLEN
jgi:hypothetical protein